MIFGDVPGGMVVGTVTKVKWCIDLENVIFYAWWWARCVYGGEKELRTGRTNVREYLANLGENNNDNKIKIYIYRQVKVSGH